MIISQKKILLKIRAYISWQTIFALCLIFVFAIFRVRAYQDSLSIGTADTNIFIANCSIPTLTWDFFTSSRPLTVSLLYKVLEPANGYQLTEVVWAWIGTAPDRVFQSGLDRITLAQSAISIFCWSALAWIVARHFRHFVTKIASILLILSFAYSPQLADWDGVLMSESLSFSLFAFLLALSIEIAFRVFKERRKTSGFTYSLAVVWVIAFTAWIFSRDSNAYFLLYTLVILLFLLLIPATRKRLPVWMLVICCGILAVTFCFQNMSLRNSDRWINPLLNNILKNVLPFPDRLEYFKGKGMPVDDELLSYINSDGNEVGFWEIEPFINWVRQHGFSSYSMFLIDHPYWSLEKLFSNLDGMFIGNRQPYFRGSPASTPLWMIPFGDILHPRSGQVVWIALFLVILLLTMSLFARKKLIQKEYRQKGTINIDDKVDSKTGSGINSSLIWSGIFMWLYFGELVLLFVSFHGDALGILRHTLVAVMPLRLSLWLMATVICDIGITQIKTTVAEVRNA